MDFLDINSVMFTIIGYPMSHIEFWGTLFGLICVWLTVKRNIWSWPVGIVNIFFFFVLFYQVRLYSDMILQFIFFVLSIYGWYRWLHPKTEEEANERNRLKVSFLSLKQRLAGAAVIAAAVVTLGLFMREIHLIFPAAFPEPAAFPFWDAATTVMSVFAQYLLAKKKIESWALWIAVDIICVALYYLKGIMFVSIEYFVFLILASSGLYGWLKAREAYENRINNRQVHAGSLRTPVSGELRS